MNLNSEPRSAIRVLTSPFSDDLETQRRYRQNQALKLGLTSTEYARRVREVTASRQGMTSVEYGRKVMEATAKRQGMSLAEYASVHRAAQAAKLDISIHELNLLKRERRAKKLGLSLAESEHQSYLRYRLRYPGRLAALDAGLNPKDVPPIPENCDFCHQPFSVSLMEKPELDHDHKRRVFRGWVHRRCNLHLIASHTAKSAILLVAYFQRLTLLGTRSGPSETIGPQRAGGGES